MINQVSGLPEDFINNLQNLTVSLPEKEDRDNNFREGTIILGKSREERDSNFI